MTPPDPYDMDALQPGRSVTEFEPIDLAIIEHQYPSSAADAAAALDAGEPVYHIDVTCIDGTHYDGIHIPSTGQTEITGSPSANIEEPSVIYQGQFETPPDLCGEPVDLPPSETPPLAEDDSFALPDEEPPPPEEPEPSEDTEPEATDEECDGCVAEPGFAESLIPFWGSYWSMIAAAQRGQTGWAVFHGAMLATDFLMVGAIVKAAGKAGAKAGASAIGTEVAENAIQEGVESIGTAAVGAGGKLTRLVEALIRLKKLTGEALIEAAKKLVDQFGTRKEMLDGLPQWARHVLGTRLDEAFEHVAREAAEYASELAMKSPPSRLVLFGGGVGSDTAKHFSGLSKQSSTIADAVGFSKLEDATAALSKMGSDPNTIKKAVHDVWKNASVKLAQNATGPVRAVMRPPLHPNSILRDELAALIKNPNVPSITILKPYGEKSTEVLYTWTRGDGAFNWSKLR